MMFTPEEDEKIDILARQNHKTRTETLACLVKLGIKFMEQECGTIITAREAVQA